MVTAKHPISCNEGSLCRVQDSVKFIPVQGSVVFFGGSDEGFGMEGQTCLIMVAAERSERREVSRSPSSCSYPTSSPAVLLSGSGFRVQTSVSVVHEG